jgi:hypothetical protein
MLSQYYASALYATKFSRAISHVSVELKTSVSQTSCLSLSPSSGSMITITSTLMMETELVFETLVLTHWRGWWSESIYSIHSSWKCQVLYMHLHLLVLFIIWRLRVMKLILIAYLECEFYIQGVHKRILHFQNDIQNKCCEFRTSHPHW